MKPIAARSVIIRSISALLSILCMVIIFMFSSENGDNSSKTSGSITETVIDIVHEDYEQLSDFEKADIYAEIEHFVRKSAHFLIYTALGFFTASALGCKSLLKAAASLGICFLYACSDELHQYFVPDRAGRFSDVLLDTAGSLTGILFLLLCTIILSRISGRRKTSSPHKTGSQL